LNSMVIMVNFVLLMKSPFMSMPALGRCNWAKSLVNGNILLPCPAASIIALLKSRMSAFIVFCLILYTDSVPVGVFTEVLSPVSYLV